VHTRQYIPARYRRAPSGTDFRLKVISTGERNQDMSKSGNLLRNFLRNEQGATAIEYGLLAAGIAVAIIATVAALGTNLNTTFSTVSTSLK
jgi:pilus assembly protein Flp/PilA